MIKEGDLVNFYKNQILSTYIDDKIYELKENEKKISIPQDYSNKYFSLKKDLNHLINRIDLIKVHLRRFESVEADRRVGCSILQNVIKIIRNTLSDYDKLKSQSGELIKSILDDISRLTQAQLNAFISNLQNVKETKLFQALEPLINKTNLSKSESSDFYSLYQALRSVL
jgi:hypothetical protein